MAGSVTMSSNQIVGVSGSSKIIGPLVVVGAGTAIGILDITFASAQYIAVTPPAFSTGCTITPPASNQVSLTLKGVTGDTGIPLQPNQSALITFANTVSPASFGLLSGGAISGNVEISYF